jgi:predicted anti-sigma-YlaC factor YlaD
MPSTTCPTADTLQKLLNKELDADAVRTLEKHLDECAACVSVLKKIEDNASAAAKRDTTASYDGSDETVGMTVGPY